jgi:hypothetical protein
MELAVIGGRLLHHRAEDAAARARAPLPSAPKQIDETVPKGSKTAAAGESSAGRPARGSLDTRAVAYFAANKSRDLTISGISQALGCNKTSLYKCKTFIGAWRLLKATQAGDVRRGSKDAESGEISVAVER